MRTSLLPVTRTAVLSAARMVSGDCWSSGVAAARLAHIVAAQMSIDGIMNKRSLGGPARATLAERRRRQAEPRRRRVARIKTDCSDHTGRGVFDARVGKSETAAPGQRS